MSSSAIVSQDLWSQSTPLRTSDVLSQIAHALELLGYPKSVAAVIKEANKQDVVVDTAEWTRAIREKTGVPLLEMYELWLKKNKSLPTISSAKADEEDEDSSSSSSSSDSNSDSEAAGALVDIEAEETSDDSSDEESSGSSDDEQIAAPVVEQKKRKRVSPRSSSSESDGDSSADEAPPTAKKVKTKAADSSSDSSSGSSSDSSSGSSSDSSSDASSSSSDSDSDSDSSSSASSSSSSSGSDSDSDASSSSSSESDVAPPPKKAKKTKKSKAEDLPEVVAVEVKVKKEKKDKKDKKEKKVVAVVVEAPSSGSSATLEAESPSDALENVQESSIHPSRLAQVPVVDLPAATRKQIAAEGKSAVIPFSRIPVDQKVDPRFASNAYVSYDYADRAHRDLVVTKGKGFTKEKNKKKRGAYRGGAIDLTPKGIKFDD